MSQAENECTDCSAEKTSTKEHQPNEPLSDTMMGAVMLARLCVSMDPACNANNLLGYALRILQLTLDPNDQTSISSALVNCPRMAHFEKLLEKNIPEILNSIEK